jgi:hypothetical protein
VSPVPLEGDPGAHIDPAHLDESAVAACLLVVSLAPLGGRGDPGDHVGPSHFVESAVEALLLAFSLAPLGGGDAPGDRVELAHFAESTVAACLVVVSLAPLGGGGDPGDHMDPAHLEESAVVACLMALSLAPLGGGPEDHMERDHCWVAVVSPSILPRTSFPRLVRFGGSMVEEGLRSFDFGDFVASVDPPPGDHMDPAHFVCEPSALVSGAVGVV